MENLKMMADEELVSLYAKGNNPAFDILLERYKKKLFSYIYFSVKNESLANDLFQDTFIKAIMRIQQGKYTESGKFSAWIMRIAHNLIVDQYRIENSENLISNDESEKNLFDNANITELDFESKLSNEQTIEDINRIMNRLPENQREVIFMRFYQDLSFKEIAEITGVSINTALGRMRYAIMNMRKMAEENHISLTIY